MSQLANTPTSFAEDGFSDRDKRIRAVVYIVDNQRPKQPRLRTCCPSRLHLSATTLAEMNKSNDDELLRLSCVYVFLSKDYENY